MGISFLSAALYSPGFGQQLSVQNRLFARELPVLFPQPYLSSNFCWNQRDITNIKRKQLTTTSHACCLKVGFDLTEQ